jgi:hypothetical protein
MKRFLSKVGLILMVSAFGLTQQLTTHTTVAILLSKLYSEDQSVRAKAFKQLCANPANLQSPRVRTALLNLLDRENHELDEQLLEAQKRGYPDEGDNAGWAEYYSNLLDAVDSFADWNDPRQACIMVDAGSSDDSAFAAKIADHAGITIPCLMKRSAISMNRAVAVPVLVQALAKGKDTLDPGTVQTARQIILTALQDPDEGVRIFTVRALGKFGKEEMIEPLRRVAEADPAPEVQGHSVRKAAADAIASIQKRASQR